MAEHMPGNFKPSFDIDASTHSTATMVAFHPGTFFVADSAWAGHMHTRSTEQEHVSGPPSASNKGHRYERGETGIATNGGFLLLVTRSYYACFLFDEHSLLFSHAKAINFAPKLGGEAPAREILTSLFESCRIAASHWAFMQRFRRGAAFFFCVLDTLMWRTNSITWTYIYCI